MPRIIKSRDGEVSFPEQTEFTKLLLNKKIIGGAAAPNTIELAFDEAGDLYSIDENGVAKRVGGGLGQIQTPIAVSPTEGATEGSTSVQLIASTFRSAYGFAHESSDWRLWDNSDSIVYTIDNDTSDLTTKTINGLSTVTDYKWAVRYKDSDGKYSDWMTTTNFTTADVYIEAPTYTGPTTDVAFYDPFTVSSFTVIGGSDGHVATQWQIAESTDPTFQGTLVYDSGDSGDLTSTSLDYTIFSTSTDYYVRVRFKGNNLGYSNWSTPVLFSTATVFIPEPIAFWDFSEGSLNDKVNSYNLTANNGSPNFTVNGIDFNSDSLYLSNSSLLSSHSGDVTIYAYANIQSAPAYTGGAINFQDRQVFIAKSDNDASDVGFEVATEPLDAISVYSSSTRSGGASIPFGSWLLIRVGIFTDSSGAIELSSSSGGGATGLPSAPNMASVSRPFVIGSRYGSNSADLIIHSIKVFDRTLTSNENSRVSGSFPSL